MSEEKIKNEEVMSESELDNVAGGTREEFEAICKALGKSPTFNTRDGIRKYLAEHFHVEVIHWNTGDRGSAKKAPAEFRDMIKDIPLTAQDIIDYIKYDGRDR